jgi:hypothetical protein
VKAHFLLAIHINFKINTICKYSFNGSMPVHCQQHVHWSLDGCMPLSDGVHRSIGHGPQSGCVILLDLHTQKNSLIPGKLLVIPVPFCRTYKFFPKTVFVFFMHLFHPSKEYSSMSFYVTTVKLKNQSNHLLLIQAVVPSLDCVIFLEKLFSHSQNPHLGVCDF